MKTTQYLSFNGKVVRTNGSAFKITATTLFGKVLVDADCFYGPQKGTYVNLMTARNALSKELRAALNMNLAS
jgi:hypothetical protein